MIVKDPATIPPIVQAPWLPGQVDIALADWLSAHYDPVVWGVKRTQTLCALTHFNITNSSFLPLCENVSSLILIALKEYVTNPR